MSDPTTTRPEDGDPQIETEQETPETVGVDEVEDAEVVDDAAPQDDPVTETPPPPAAEPTPAAPLETRRGPGFVPLVLGGIVAAGIGYGAAFMGFAPTQSTNDDSFAAAVMATF